MTCQCPECRASWFTAARRETMIAQAVEGLRLHVRLVDIQRQCGMTPTLWHLRRAALARNALTRSGYFI